MSEPDWIQKAWEKPLPKPKPPPPPPGEPGEPELPLTMNSAELNRIEEDFGRVHDTTLYGDAILVEILIALRQIADQLDRLIRRSHHADGD